MKSNMKFNNPEISTLLLSFGKHVVLFDKDLEPEIKKYSWSIHPNGYVRCCDEGTKYTYMHQFVLEFSGNGTVSPDHINRIKTDNRRANLRIVSQSDNVKNRVVRDDKLRGSCLTKREIEFLIFCHSYSDVTGVFPTYREIIDGMNFKSPNSVTQYLKSLCNKEMLVRNPIHKYIFTENCKDSVLDL